MTDAHERVLGQRLNGKPDSVVSTHDDIQAALAERALGMAIDGIPFVDPDSIKSGLIQETAVAIRSSKGYQPEYDTTQGKTKENR